MKQKAFVTTILAILCLSQINCRNDKKSLQSILEGKCFWDYWDKNETQSISSGYKFRDSGQCYYFEYSFKNDRRSDSVDLFYEGDQILPKTWSIIGDSILIVQEFPMRVLTFNSDTVFLAQKGRKDTIYLIKNCKTVSKSKYF